MFLVTGGSGFIGSHIAHRLVADGHAVRVLDDLSSGSMDNLLAIRNDMEFVYGDIRDADLMCRAAEDVDVIFHQAAEPSVPRSLADPATTFDVNVEGTRQVLEAARANGCRRVVFATTCAIYGDGPELPKVESLAPRPMTPYAMSKLTGEHLCAMYSRLYGVETVGLRYFNVFGPRQSPFSAYAAAIPRFVDAILSGRRPQVYGDGEQSRDFVAVADVVRANLLAAHAAGASGKVFNVASGKSVTINEVLATLSEATGLSVFPDYAPARPGDILHSSADVALAKFHLGYEAATTFRTGIEFLLQEYPVAHDIVAA